MRWKRIVIATTSVVLASCALVSGAGDLTIGEPGLPEAGALEASSPGEDAASIDAPGPQGDAATEGGPTTCDEPGLVARWTFDEGDGGQVRDCTRFHHDGRVDGGVWAQGKRDGGMSFDGGWVGFGDPADLQLTGALTVCAWIRPEGVVPPEPARGYIVGKLVGPTVGGWRLATARAASAVLIAGAMNVPNDGGQNEAKGGAMMPGAWSHVCGRYESTATTMFVDGKLVATTATTAAKLVVTSDELRVGTRADGAQPYIGVVDEVRIYARPLSDAEIAALAQP